jgi:hypothetical protein
VITGVDKFKQELTQENINRSKVCWNLDSREKERTGVHDPAALTLPPPTPLAVPYPCVL